MAKDDGLGFRIMIKSSNAEFQAFHLKPFKLRCLVRAAAESPPPACSVVPVAYILGKEFSQLQYTAALLYYCAKA